MVTLWGSQLKKSDFFLDIEDLEMYYYSQELSGGYYA